jgi:lipopolysaccharide export system protein LptC
MRYVAFLPIAFLIAVGPACGRARPGEVHEVVPELALEGVRFRVWRGAELRVEGQAKSATLRRDSSELVARDVLAVLPRAEVPVRITAPIGTGVLQAQAFEARGGVVVERGADVARTESARYAPLPAGGAIVRGEEPVELDGRGYRMRGTGFTLDPATGDLDLTGTTRLVAGLPEAR